MIGSQPHKIVGTPWLCICAIKLAAWFDIVPRSSWYCTLTPGSQPAALCVSRATCTDSWYQEFSGANEANLRGRPLRLPPARSAGLPHSFFTAYSAAQLATSVPALAIDQMYGACSSCHCTDRYGSPKPTTSLLASALAYGSEF